MNETDLDPATEDISQPRPDDAIRIPTARPDPPRGNSRAGSRQAAQLQAGLRENRFSLPNLSKYSNLVTNYQSNDDPMCESHSPRRTSTRQEAYRNANSWFSEREQTFSGHFNIGGSAMSTDFPSEQMPVSRTTTPRVTAKQSRSFHNLRRSHSPTKGTRHGNSFAYTSPERHLTAHAVWGIGDEHPTESIDFVRSSMTISRMTLRSPDDVQNTNNEFLLTEEINLDEVKPEMYGDTLAKTKRVLPFRRIAHPEIHGHTFKSAVEEFYDKPPSVQR